MHTRLTAGSYKTPDFEIISADVLNSTVSYMSSGGGSGGGWGGGGSGPITPTVGTESNPYTLTTGIPKTVSSTTLYWFKCTLAGSADLDILCNASGTLSVYEKDFFSTTLITQIILPVHEVPFAQYGTHTRYYKVSLSSSTSFTITVSQHCDSECLDDGGRWEPNNNSGCENASMLPMGCSFFTADATSRLIELVDQDEYLELLDELIQGTLLVADAALIASNLVLAGMEGLTEFVVTYIAEQYSWIFQKLLTIPFPDTIKDLTVDLIKQRANYSVDVGGLGVAQHGIRFSWFRINGLPIPACDTWDGPVAYGPQGAIGELIEFDSDFPPSIAF